MPVPAWATFTGLIVTATNHVIGASDPGAPAAWQGQTITTLEVFATFDSPGDALTAVFGNVPHPLTLQLRNNSDTGPGTAFFNNTFGGNSAPNSALYGQSPSLEHDTYLSMGMEPTPPTGTDSTIFSPDFFGGASVNAPFSMDTGITGGTNHAWLGPGLIPQEFAGPDLRTMLGQFTVRPGENIRGTLNITYRPAGATHDTFVYAASDPNLLVFNTAVPAGSAPAFIFIAALAGCRRRRTLG